MESSGKPHSSDRELLPQLPDVCDSASRMESDDDIDFLLGLSSEAEFSSSAQTNDIEFINESNIFADDYFKVNMPSVYKSNNESKTNKSETCNSQPLVELDVVPYGITLYPFYAQFDNELSFHEGEIVTLCRHVGRDWIEGKIDGKKGIFPKSYVNILVDCEDYVGDKSYNSLNDVLGCETYPDTKLTPNLFARVLYNFNAQMNDDLTVNRNEVVFVVTEVNEDWCEVRNRSGKLGLCPRNYLTPYLLPDELNSELLQESSTATHLFDVSSSTDESISLKTQYVPDDSSDFLQTGNLSSQKDRSIDEFISKNLEMYHISVKSSCPRPGRRHSVNLSEERNLGKVDERVTKHRLSYSLQQEEECSTFEQCKANFEPVDTQRTSLRLQPVQSQEGGKDRPSEESCGEEMPWEEGKLIFDFDHRYSLPPPPTYYAQIYSENNQVEGFRLTQH
jgi:hypothetical protein